MVNTDLDISGERLKASLRLMPRIGEFGQAMAGLAGSLFTEPGKCA